MSQAPKPIKVLKTTSPSTPHAAAAVRKAAARLAFTGVVATAAASFAPPALAKGGGRGGGGGSSSYSSSYRSSSYDRSYYDDYYDDIDVVVGFTFLGFSILVDPDSKPIPDGWKTRIRNAKLDEWEANREIYSSKLAATNRLMATLQDDFAAARSGAGDRLRTGRYVGRTTEDDGGDQSIVANLCFKADGRVTGSGRDGVDGSYTLAGRYFEGRCAWVETYSDGLKVAVTGAVPRWPGSRLELSFVSNRGITGSASLRRVAETSGRAAAMHGAAVPVLAIALAGAAVLAPHPAYARRGDAYHCRTHPYSSGRPTLRGSYCLPQDSAPKCAVLYQARGGPFYGPGVLAPSSFPSGRFATVTYPAKKLDDGTSRPLIDEWSRNWLNVIRGDLYGSARCVYYLGADGAPAFALPDGGDVLFYGSQVFLLVGVVRINLKFSEKNRYIENRKEVKALMQTLATTSALRGRAPADGRYAGGRPDVFGVLRKTIRLNLPPSATVDDVKQKLRDNSISLDVVDDRQLSQMFGDEWVKEGRPLGGRMRQQKEIVEKYEVLAATEWDLTFAANGKMYGTGVDAPGTLEGRWAGGRCAWIETYDYGMGKARAPDLEVVVTGKLVSDGIDVDFYSNQGRKGSAQLRVACSASRAAMTDVVSLVAAALRPARAGAEPSLARAAA